MTQEQLAQLTVKAIGLLERGERQTPYSQTVRNLATALGLSVTEIATWRDMLVARPGPARL